MSLYQRLCPTRRCTVAVHSNRRTSGKHPHEGSREDKVCILQRKDGDDEESFLVEGMDIISIQREMLYRGSSDSGSVKGSSTKDSSAANEGQRLEISSTEDASKAEQHAAGILLEHLPC